MKNNSINIISLIILFTALGDASLNIETTSTISNSYFPVNNSIELVYKSSFGECITTYTQNGGSTISSSEADDFEYRQAMIDEFIGVFIGAFRW